MLITKRELFVGIMGLLILIVFLYSYYATVTDIFSYVLKSVNSVKHNTRNIP